MIILMGPIGSGKSEQTKRLAARLRIGTVSTSQLLRDNLTPGLQAKMQTGDLISDSEMIKLVQPVLKGKEASGGNYVLDGFPRSIPQAEWLVSQIKIGNIESCHVIKLNVSDNEVLKRLLARGRSDDKENIIKHRLEVYRQTTVPIIEYLRRHNVTVHKVDGEKKPDEVEQAISRIINS